VSYKSILLLLDDGKSNADRINTAITIAKTHNAHPQLGRRRRR